MAGNSSVTQENTSRKQTFYMELDDFGVIATKYNHLVTQENTSRKQTFYMELDDFGVIETKYNHLICVKWIGIDKIL